MEPFTAAGLVIGVAGLAGQVFSKCISGIQFIITAINLPKECQYLNLRLRMEQQRLFAWSETSGLLEHVEAAKDDPESQRLIQSNAFGLHRSTVLDLLLQINLLFDEFEAHQKRHRKLQVTEAPSSPARQEGAESCNFADAPDELVPVTARRRRYIDAAMRLYRQTHNVQKRLRWAAVDKDAFESLLRKFSSLNDSITSYLDAKMQSQIYHATQDTNRGVLQLHHQMADLQQLVKATLVLNLGEQIPKTSFHPKPEADRDRLGFALLADLARFKAFERSLDADKPVDAELPEYACLDLGTPSVEKETIRIQKSQITLHGPFADDEDSEMMWDRCEATYARPDGSQQQVWIEWKEYDWQPQRARRPPPLIMDRVSMLAMLLHHRPKPASFRVPHCVGYFDNSPSSTEPCDRDGPRIGFVFEKPPEISPSTPPTSLLSLLQHAARPRVTERVKLARAVANSLFHLHAVNWLHKGLRSHNIVFFAPGPGGTGPIDYGQPYLAGFDFARPARPQEKTEVPGENAEHDLYRHPGTQGNAAGPRASFRKSFDIYSVGVILVELAHWRRVDAVLGIDLGERARGRWKMAQGVRARLLADAQMAELGASMGEVYEAVTRRCLAGGAEVGIGEGEDETDDHVAAALSRRFYEDVVKKLDEIHV